MAFSRKISMFCVMYCNLVTYIVYNISNLLSKRETIDMFTTFSASCLSVKCPFRQTSVGQTSGHDYYLV